jgi:hypothetical protein
MAYINHTELRMEFESSRFCGSPTKRFKEIIGGMVEHLFDRLIVPQDSKDAFIWYTKKNFYKYWNNYDPLKNENPYPYYTEIIKRLMMKTFQNTDKIKHEYYWYKIVKSREGKLKKLNSLS